MNKPAAAIKGTFSDFRIIRGRKVAALVIEIPLEEADAALKALGGVPIAESERWVAIARLNPKAVQQAQEGQEHNKPRRAFQDLPLPQQIGIRCNDEQFWRFLSKKGPAIIDVQGAAAIVRAICCVTSRAEIRTGTGAADEWKKIDNEFWIWQRGYGDA